MRIMKITCPYFGKCGGCRYLDLEPDAYEKLKRAQIERAFSFMQLDIPIKRFIRLARWAFGDGRLLLFTRGIWDLTNAKAIGLLIYNLARC